MKINVDGRFVLESSRQVQHITDQLVHLFYVALQPLEQGGRGVGLHDFEGQAHACQRCSQIVRNTRQQGGACRQQLAHLSGHGIKAPAQADQFAGPSFRQQPGCFTLPDQGAGCFQPSQWSRDAPSQAISQRNTKKQAAHQTDEQGRKGLGFDPRRCQPDRQLPVAYGHIGPVPGGAVDFLTHQMLRGPGAPNQRLLQHIEVKRMPFILAGAAADSSQGQRVTGQQFFFECRTRFRRQFSPGLRREHHQPGQVIGRTSRQRQQDKQNGQRNHQQLDHDKRSRQHQRGLTRQTLRGTQGLLPWGLNR